MDGWRFSFHGVAASRRRRRRHRRPTVGVAGRPGNWATVNLGNPRRALDPRRSIHINTIRVVAPGGPNPWPRRPPVPPERPPPLWGWPSSPTPKTTTTTTTTTTPKKKQNHLHSSFYWLQINVFIVETPYCRVRVSFLNDELNHFLC